MSNAPVETKVVAATVGAGAGAIVSEFVIWGLDEMFWNGAADPSVPTPVAAFVTLAITAGLAWVAGYVKTTPLAKLQARTADAERKLPQP